MLYYTLNLCMVDKLVKLKFQDCMFLKTQIPLGVTEFKDTLIYFHILWSYVVSYFLSFT